MNILYIGDIMGEPGRETVRLLLPNLRKELNADLVIAQAENVSHGVGITPQHMDELISFGVDAFTGGNHIYKKDGIHSRLKDTKSPIIGPANMNVCPGNGYISVETANGSVLVVSILGSIFPLKDGESTENPLKTIDTILEDNNGKHHVATIVNFHGDWSSEKIAIGHYLDGRVSAVVGDHWHVPTADARILPKGTAHISDVGMTGALDSCLGVELDKIIPRWREGVKNKNELEVNKPWQLNAVLISTSSSTEAKLITQIHREIN